MTASSMNAKKLSCPKCATAVCFRCREEWHGHCTSCEKAMEKKFQGWGTGAERIIFCPMCRTKIQRSSGCNHMTCGFCKFEFCYCCGAEAGSGSGHWTTGLGCGATMMQPHTGTVRSEGCQRFCFVLIILGMILSYPILVVLGPAMAFTGSMVYPAFRANKSLGFCSLLLTPVTIIAGLILDICWTPAALICLPVAFIIWIS